MKNTKLLVIGSIIASVMITASAFADTTTATGTGTHRVRGNRTWSHSGALSNSGTMAAFKANVTRTVTNISNGVQITQTTSDANTLAQLNTMFTKQPAPKSNNPLVTVTKTQISNGIQTAITSTDAATITQIQSSGGDLGKIKAAAKPTTTTKKPVLKKMTAVKKVTAKKSVAKKTTAKKVVKKKVTKKVVKK